jgi:hypothetical protein
MIGHLIDAAAYIGKPQRILINRMPFVWHRRCGNSTGLELPLAGLPNVKNHVERVVEKPIESRTRLVDGLLVCTLENIAGGAYPSAMRFPHWYE